MRKKQSLTKRVIKLYITVKILKSVAHKVNETSPQ